MENRCNECGIPLEPGYYGSFCSVHMINSNGCCRDHCLINEEGGGEHCIHCIRKENSACCYICDRLLRRDSRMPLCSICIEDNSEITYVKMYRALNELIYTVIDCGNDQLCRHFQELIANFRIEYSPILWSQDFIYALTGNISQYDDPYLIADDMHKFVEIVVEYLKRKEFTYNDLCHLIESDYSEEIAQNLYDLIDVLFETYDDSEDNMDVDTVTNATNYFHELYQDLAPTRESQIQRLAEINVHLCMECMIPCESIWCDNCSFE